MDRVGKYEAWSRERGMTYVVGQCSTEEIESRYRW